MAQTSAALQQVYDVLIATFPGEPTDQAVDDLQREVLKRMEATDPRGVILDISAVTTLDSFFARVISETASMISLLGGEAIVVGMRPSVAITAAELGFDLVDVETARSTDHALELLGITIEAESPGPNEDSRTNRPGAKSTDPRESRGSK